MKCTCCGEETDVQYRLDDATPVFQGMCRHCVLYWVRQPRFAMIVGSGSVAQYTSFAGIITVSNASCRKQK